MAYGNENIFTGLIDEQGNILLVSSSRDYKKVGIDTRRESELLQEIKERDETLDNWRNVLIENGLLKIPKTAEELAAEAASEQIEMMQRQAAQQAEINRALLESIQSQNQLMGDLQSQIKELKKNGTANGNDSPIPTKSSASKRTQNSKRDGEKPGTGKVGIVTGSENPA